LSMSAWSRRGAIESSPSWRGCAPESERRPRPADFICAAPRARLLRSRAGTSACLATTVAFFFPAEDGIRVFHVTGVQTCALPILRLLARGINPAVAAPLSVAHKDLSTPAARRGLAMAFLPYLLILSAFIGGAHLIIDTTAGERERQSLEPLLATPASRGAIVSGKILAASLVGLAALLLTLLALKAGAQLVPGIGRMMDMSMLAIVKMLLVLLPMLFIGTALLTFIAAGAKSVKEAQSYMSMLMLLPIVPTVILMVSPVRTQLWQYVVPFLAQNQMLLKVIRAEAIAPLEWA